MLYIYLSLFAALCFSFTDITTKILLNNGVSNLQYLFWTKGIIFTLITLLILCFAIYFSFKVLTNGDGFSQILTIPNMKIGFYMIITTIFSFIGLVALVYAFNISDNVGYTSTIVRTTALMTFFLLWLIYGKKPELIGLQGAVLIIIGVFFIGQCKN